MALVFLAGAEGQCRIFALSTDAKPDPAVSTGFSLFEVDTGHCFLCDGAVWDDTTAIGGGAAWGSITGTLGNQSDLVAALDAKQVTLVSGTNLKTVNGSTLLGSGNLAVSASDPGYAPGSFTVATETARATYKRLQLTGAQRATLAGTGRLRLSN